MREISELKNRLEELNSEIEETQQRIPAHSVKPEVMMTLFELEDERARLIEALDCVSKGSV